MLYLEILRSVTVSNSLILIVEDNESILFNLKLSLELNGFQVMTASNGLEALNFLQTSKILPNLILSDIMMPEMGGYDLLENIKKSENCNNIPFIVISAKSTPSDIRFAKSIGVTDYITKPIDEDNLLKRIRKNLTN